MKPTIIFEDQPLQNGYAARVVVTTDEEDGKERVVVEKRELDSMGVVRWVSETPARNTILERALFGLSHQLGLLEDPYNRSARTLPTLETSTLRGKDLYGMRVVTVKPVIESSDWDTLAKANRLWDVTGTIVSHSDSHGLVYKVAHGGAEFGEISSPFGWYEPRELRLV